MRELSLTEVQMVSGSGLLGGGLIMGPFIAGLSTVALTPTVDLWLPPVQHQASHIADKYEVNYIGHLHSFLPQSLQQLLSSHVKHFCIGATSYLIARII